LTTLRFWTTLSLLCAAAIPLVSLALFFPWSDDVPRWDQWALVPMWEAHFAGQPVLPLLLEPYNNHMNVAPRALFFVLGLVTRWSLRTEILVGYLLATCLAAVLILMLRDTGERFLLLAAPVTLQVFSLIQYGGFLTGYAVGHHLCQLGIATTIFALTRPRISGLHVGAAALAAAVATFSWGSGVVTWPLGILILLVRKQWRWTVWTLWVGLTVAALLVVRIGGGSLAGLPFIVRQPHFALFGLTLIGKPVSPWGFPEASMALVLGILLAVAFAATLVRAWELGPPLLLLRWGLLGASGLGAAALITLARGGSPLEQALAPQYVGATYFVGLALLVLLSHCFWTTWERPGSRAIRWAGGAAFVLLLVTVGAREWSLAHNLLPTLFQWRQITAGFADKVLDGTITDDEIRKTLHPDVELVRHSLTVLRRHRLALYRDHPEV
jgi:hypothetical protein